MESKRPNREGSSRWQLAGAAGFVGGLAGGFIGSLDGLHALFTSGLGEIFPRGILVGKLLAVEPAPGSLTTTAQVKLSVNSSKLNEVWVLMQ